MAVYNPDENTCRLYSDAIVPEQYGHLIDDEKCRLTERKFGKLKGKYVIYNGSEFVADNGICYVNAAEYLKKLPEQRQLIKNESPGFGINYGI